MCGHVNNNCPRPAPKPPVVSPEAPNAPAVVSPEGPQRSQRQGAIAPIGHSMQDTFEGARNNKPKQAPHFLQRFEKVLQKVERLMPQLQDVMDWIRGIVGDAKKAEPNAPFTPR